MDADRRDSLSPHFMDNECLWRQSVKADESPSLSTRPTDVEYRGDNVPFVVCRIMHPWCFAVAVAAHGSVSVKLVCFVSRPPTHHLAPPLISLLERCGAASPRLWNTLPVNIRASGTLSVFRKSLKTYLFIIQIVVKWRTLLYNFFLVLYMF